MENLFRVRLVGGNAVIVLGQRLHPDATAPTDHIEEQVRGDAVQPAFERAGLIVLNRTEHPDESLLGQILGVVLVTREPIRQAVDPVGVLTHQFVPGRHRRPVTGRIEHRGAVQLVGLLRPVRVGTLADVRHCGRGRQGSSRRILLVFKHPWLRATRRVTRHNTTRRWPIPPAKFRRAGSPTAMGFHADHLSLPCCGSRVSKLNVD